ncbi:putative UMP kinase [Ostertagia ostertagi]
MGDRSFGISPSMLELYANDIKTVTNIGVQVAVVIGGGNIYRGMNEAETGIERAQGDYMGMLATVINGMALQAALEKAGVKTRLQSAIKMEQVAEPYIRRRAMRHLEKGRVVIFGAGTAFALTVRTLFNQKKLSEIKSDFINNMTHELKTPLATISLAVDALNNHKVINDEEKIRYYSGMIREENKRMNKQVETILQAARIERQEISLNLQELNAHEIIRKVADNLTLQIQERKGTLNLNLKAAKHKIIADDVHFSNIIFNLLDNAIKYSREDAPLQINLETVNNGSMFAIRVRDNGIGMNKETQARVFEKFYRAHTGNLHNVKGFGLGLSYVKAMVDAHHGRIKLESTLGKGSMFIVSFPASV